MGYKMLAINPGSTSTKIAVYANTECLFGEVLRHAPSDLVEFAKIYDQLSIGCILLSRL